MARDSSCAVRDGKSGKIHKMDQKIDGEILNYQHNKIQKFFQGLTIENISSKSQLNYSLNRLKIEIELFHELQKYYKRNGTVKLSKKLKIKKMKIETEFLINSLMDDYNEEEINKRNFENFHLPTPNNKNENQKIFEDIIRNFGL